MNYELMVALVREEALKSVKETLETAQAKIISEDVWGKRRLAYRIGQTTEGFYAVWQLELAPAAVKTLSKQLTMNKKEVLRYLFVRS